MAVVAVWWGAFTGIVISIIAGGVFAALYYLASSRLFQVRLKQQRQLLYQQQQQQFHFEQFCTTWPHHGCSW